MIPVIAFTCLVAEVLSAPLSGRYISDDLIICPTQAVRCSPPTNHTFSYLDDIADLAVIRGRAPSTSAYRDGLLRRDEETSASVGSDTVPPSSVVSSCSAAVL